MSVDFKIDDLTGDMVVASVGDVAATATISIPTNPSEGDKIYINELVYTLRSTMTVASFVGGFVFYGNPFDGDTLVIGTPPGSGVTYRFKNTMTANGDVQIGATLADTVVHMKKAIDQSGTIGVDYYSNTGTWSALLTPTTTNNNTKIVLTTTPTWGEAGVPVSSSSTVIKITAMVPHYSVKLGSTLTDTISHITNTINGTGSAGVDYYTGTPSPNVYVSSVAGQLSIGLVARVAGKLGNKIAISATSSVMVFSGPTMTGGGTPLVKITGINEVRQRIRTRILKQLGEWRYNLASGVPWSPYRDQAGILGSKNSAQQAQAIITDVVSRTDGVTLVKSVSVRFDTATRTFKMQLEVATVYGSVTLSL